jgi:hypothetical protein
MGRQQKEQTVAPPRYHDVKTDAGGGMSRYTGLATLLKERSQ